MASWDRGLLHRARRARTIVHTVHSVCSVQGDTVSYEMTSGQLAAALRAAGTILSVSTVQRYAREGRIPSRPTPGGRYRYDLQEVLAALSTSSPTVGLSAPTLAGGLGTAELPADSAAERRRRQVRGHASVTAATEVLSRPSAMHEQIATASRRSLAFT
jgi:hypothetical protein